MPTVATAIASVFENEHPIYEWSVNCRVLPEMAHFSYNPTLLVDPTDPESGLLQFTSDPEFQPYVTAVGLYNDERELLAIAKVRPPVPVSKFLETDILIQMDY